MIGIIYGLFCNCAECNPYEIRYVGQSIDVVRRFKRHIYDSRFLNSYLYRWIRKHGSENISYIILEEVELINDELNEAEKRWIKAKATFHGVNKKGLNFTTGGDSGHIGSERPQEVKNRIANTLRGKKRDPKIAEKARKTRHDREHKNGPPPRTTCIYCYPDGRPPKRSSSHSRFHEKLGYWKEECIGCTESFRDGKPSKEEYILKKKDPLKPFGAGENKATHNRWHVNRNLPNPKCPYCQELL